ncbi:MAG TPA: winged helix DNA-binding domain-containing protein [Candidatus Saccharimonas sp.]|nr:winged helix DNA-binding domain-containing protein [Candidatus Saccharimonas sp.]
MLRTEIAQRRLASQALVGSNFDSPVAVVRHMGAMQAQDYGQAVWAVGARCGASLQKVEAAIASGEIVRTWPMRGTIHFVPREDAAWMLQLLTPRIITADKRRQERLGLTISLINRCGEILQANLNGGKQLTRPQIAELLAKNGIDATGPRLYHTLWYLSQVGLICIGPMQGKQQTFMLLKELAPNSRKLSREDALAELAKRYFTSHGPATIADFANWAGIGLTIAREGLAFVKGGLTSVTVDEKTYWFASSVLSSAQQSVLLLPGFDEYLLGYKDRSAVLELVHAGKVVPGGNGVFKPMVVLNGEVVGTWKRTVKKAAVHIAIDLFTPVTLPQDLLAKAVQQYGDFLNLPTELIVH